MPRRESPARAGWNSWSWAVLAGVLLAGPAWAGAWPQLVAAAGGTTAVLGTPNDGGVSLSLSALWPLGDGLAFGVMAHGDDAGSLVDSLRTEDGVGLSYGRIEQLHRLVWGASWRLDATGPAVRGVVPYVSGTWGFYRVRDDVRGRQSSDVGSTGFSLAAGASLPLARGFSMGLVARYHRLLNDRAGRFVNAGLSVSWR